MAQGRSEGVAGVGSAVLTQTQSRTQRQQLSPSHTHAHSSLAAASAKSSTSEKQLAHFDIRNRDLSDTLVELTWCYLLTQTFDFDTCISVPFSLGACIGG